MKHASPFAAGLAVLSAWAALALVTAQAQAADILTGTPEIIDGRTLTINGKKIVLADIVIPNINSRCIWKGKVRPCGELSKAGLQDITVASTLTCTPVKAPIYRCVTEDDFDVGFGQLHAGWAVPAASAPAHYRERSSYARSKGHGLWVTTTLDGQSSYLDTLPE